MLPSSFSGTMVPRPVSTNGHVRRLRTFEVRDGLDAIGAHKGAHINCEETRDMPRSYVVVRFLRRGQHRSPSWVVRSQKAAGDA
jgi:hypothetical protein